MRTKELLRAITPAPLWGAASAARRRLQGHWKRSFSGYGEDLLVLGWLQNYRCDISKVRYVDVGAAHPTRLSNTYLLYCAGARGILIEPDPDQASLLRAKRPRDIVVNAGIAFDERREATYFRMTTPVFNTFSPEQAEFAIKSSAKWPPKDRQAIVDRIQVPLIPINEVIAAHLAQDAVDFLSIDAEGVDLPILQTFDLGLMRSRPEIPALICIEASASLDAVSAVVEPAGFELTGRSPDNWLFRRHRERFRRPAQ
jgi:FkbM family methyltransferase